MKKFLLALCCAAAMTASADTVTFVPQFGGYVPGPEDGTVITIPVTWAGQTLYSDAFNMYISAGSLTIQNGAIYIASSGVSESNPEGKQAYVEFRPCAGVTIKKIEFQMFPQAVKDPGKAMATNFDDTALDETGIKQQWSGKLEGNADLTGKQVFKLHKEGETPVSTERVRLHAIRVEYDGTVGRCLMPKASNNDVVTSNAITLTCDEPGATIWYSTNAAATYYVYDQQPDEEFVKYEGQPIEISQVTKLNAYATVDGKKKSGLYYNWIVPGPEGSQHAVFDFSRPATLNPSLSVTPLVPLTDHLASATINKSFNNNGITLSNYSTASSTTNGIRFMATDAYGCMGEVRVAAKNGAKNNNTLDISADNPENYICQVTFIGSEINKMLSAAQHRVVFNEEKQKYVLDDEPYVFPGDYNYDDETAANYKNTVFVQTNELPSVARKYVVTWRLSEDFMTDVVNRVVFDQFDTSSASRFNQLHVFYWGEAPDPSGVDGIVADKVDENAPVEYFNLQGIRVANPQGGIFIKRQGSKVTKVLVK